MPTHRDTFSTYLRNPKSEHSSLDSMKTIDSVNVPKKINANGLTVGKTYTKPQLVKNDIVTSTKNTQCSISASRNEWLLDLCCSLQESALKALRLSNEKYEATMDKLKQQVAADGVNGSNTALLVDYPPAFPPAKTPLPSDPLITEDAPPKPPPRHLSTQPPPLPPPPASHLRQKPRHGYAQPVTEYAPRHVPSPQYLCGASPASKIYDYRHSPSSGFYSCSAGSPSPSSVSLESDNAPQGACDNAGSVLVTQFVKSTQVPKPLLQTACAPINDPPSYASTMQQRNSSPPLKHHSPIPERRCKPLDCKVRNYSPQAFKFFMEQHVENVLKSYKQRIFRRMQLESEMAKIRLPEQARNQMRKMLCQKESNYIRLRRAKMDKSMFNSIRVIGVGAFGEVALVRKIDTNHLYAMKTLRKADVLKRKQVAHVKAERDILAEADNEWVVKLYYSFQDNDNLYFIMEYIPGGDLMSLLIKLGIFDEPLAKFYLAELTCAVESVHKIGFIHRDIKPDNILIDRDGHIKLTDFGLCTGFRWTHNSKYYNNDQHNRQNSLDFNDTWTQNTVNCKCSHLKPLERRRRREHQRCQAHSLVGTPNYIAPEVLLRTGYTQLCDWWSVGVVLYEMLVGAPPFAADSPSETQYKIINWKNTLKIPPNSNVSAEGIDLILKLCTSQDQRLGKNVDEVKQHPFFAGVNFDKGVRKTTPPYIPTIHYLTDTSNFDSIDQSSLHESNSATSDYSEASDDDKAFHGFFEFTFRRFFDDAGGGIPFHTKITSEESDNQIAIYV